MSQLRSDERLFVNRSRRGARNSALRIPGGSGAVLRGPSDWVVVVWPVGPARGALTGAPRVLQKSGV